MKRTIRVATFNVFYGDNPHKIGQAIRANKNLADADIILLQEVEAHSDEIKERATIIAEELGLSCIYAPARASGKETKLNGTHGLAILSRFTVKESQIIPLKKYNLHFNSRDRIALSAILQIDGELVQVCNVHLDLRINIKDRLDQITDLIEKLSSHQIKKIIIGGDFNTVPIFWAARVLPIFYSAQKNKFDKYILSKGYKGTVGKVGPTMHLKLLRFSLDDIYVKDLDFVKHAVERDLTVSDHKPVWADIQL
ncbi:MAG: hypothetical protein JWO40_297 [Candidatus Doudnabacteria bacterium]|nr:hypothetical protein [Candidatus Doudnabacteria bacterium]